MNVLDGERMAGQLEAAGSRRGGRGDEADVLLLNTCAVREKAEARSSRALGVLARAQARATRTSSSASPGASPRSRKEILERAPWVDFVAGTGQVEKHRRARRAARPSAPGPRARAPEEDPVYQFRQIARGSAFQAYVTVIEGCDQFCTFCIVPFTRGRERSRAPARSWTRSRSSRARATPRSRCSARPSTPTATRSEGFGLGELLRRAARIEGLRRLRFLTSHPRFVDDGPRRGARRTAAAIAPYLHLPAQSGSDRVLCADEAAVHRGRVPRRSSRACAPRRPGDRLVLRLHRRISRARPRRTSRTTLALVATVRFASLFGFRYSPRPGTAAARWGSETEVPEEVAAERLARLLDLQAEHPAARATGASWAASSRSSSRATDRQGQSDGPDSLQPDRPRRSSERAGAAAGRYARVRITRGLPNSLIGRLAAYGSGIWGAA